MKILIVEDQSDVRLLLTKLLTSKGHAVSQAENGSQGLNNLTRDDFDLIITDLNMPILDGLGFSIQSRKTGFKAPILLFTSEKDVDLGKCNLGGITAIIKKNEINRLMDMVAWTGNQ